MATPQRTEYVTFVDGASELMCGSKAVDCYDWSALFGVGDSRGSNRRIPGVAGTVARPHVRDQLNAELAFRVRGAYSEDNVSQPEANHRANVLARLVEVRGFLDGAAGRQLELRLTTGAGSTTHPATFMAMGSVEFPTPEIGVFRVLVAVRSGLFTVSA